MSMKLAEIQRTLFSAIATAAPIDAKQLEGVVTAGTLAPVARVEIYAEMYWLRMRDTLRDDFKLTRRFLGDESFDTQVARYIHQVPSTHYSLGQRGAQFADFLKSNQNNLPAGTSDLATLEWARAQAFVAENSEVATFSQMAAAAQRNFSETRLTCCPSLHLLQLTYSVGALWRALEAAQEVTAPAATHTCLVVWRREGVVYHSEILKAERAALAAAQQQQSLPQLCEFFETPEAAFQAIGSWVTEGMVSHVE
jgi:hypothetical protein